MRKLYTLVAAFIATTAMVKAQSVELINTDWTDVNPAFAVAAAGVLTDNYNVTGGVFNFKGAKYNDTNKPTIIPEGETIGVTLDPTTDATIRYMRVGSNTTLTDNVPTNHFYQFTPTNPFVNGGKVTLTISFNGTAEGIGVYDMTDKVALGIIDISQLAIQKYHDVTFDLPTTLNGLKTIGFCRIKLDGTVGGVTFFTWKAKLETNESGGTTAVKNIQLGKAISTEYLNLTGAKVGANYKDLNAGIYLQKTTYDNGQTVTTKILKQKR
ncbi:MAG: hypothetical protein QM786_08160 [Breznakibacter sp.]